MCISRFVLALFLFLLLVLKQIPKTVQKKELFIWTLVFRNFHLQFRAPLFSRPELKKSIVGETYGEDGHLYLGGQEAKRVAGRNSGRGSRKEPRKEQPAGTRAGT